MVKLFGKSKFNRIPVVDFDIKVLFTENFCNVAMMVIPSIHNNNV